MNIIENYKERKKLNQPINLVINSSFDYKDHDTNVLKACLKKWSEGNNYSPLHFNWIYADPELKNKIFFVATTLKELQMYHLEHIITEQNVIASSYMGSYFNTVLFTEYDNVA